ncbi:hypothetical protein EsH8_X_000016 [Colletotrichum jinshuiense]
MSNQQPPRPLSHLQPVPADSISALYDNDKKTLILEASGNAVNITTDIHFQRLPFLGGLLYELQGWVGPVTLGDEPYSVTNSFNIDLPSRVFPSGTVVIKTANNNQWVIKIEPLLKKGTQKPQTATNATAEFDVPEVNFVPAREPIITGLGQSFTIQQSDKFTGKGGSVDISFNSDFVTLTNAGIKDGSQIEWTFTSHQTGNTEVVVFVGQTSPPFVYRVPYSISIAPPNANATLKPLGLFSVTENPAHATNESSYGNYRTGDNTSIPLSWDGVVNIGVDLIKKQHPDSKLYEVDASPATTKPVSNEWGLSDIRIVARLDDNKTAIIQSQGWGDFGPVEVVQSPFLGDVVIPWPVSLTIHEAFTILRKGGYEGPVSTLTLRQPLGPDINQPFYIFKLGSQFIAVGVDDKKIHNFGLTGQEIQQN